MNMKNAASLREAAFFVRGAGCGRAVFAVDWGQLAGSGSFVIHFKIRTQSCPKTKVANYPPKEAPMRQLIRPAAFALSIACLVTPLALAPTTAALAQQQGAGGPPPDLKQIALSQKQIDGVVAAQKDMDAATANLQPNSKPDAKVVAQLEGISKKNGFASYDEYNNVMDNIGLVFSGIDSTTKKYVGSEAVIKAQIAETQADKKMSPKDKKAALEDLNAALKDPGPEVQNKGNIDLVVKNYDKLLPIMGDSQN